jgi:hypothetical protein
MVEKEDLGLSLSLSFPQNNHHSLQQNLMMPCLHPSSASTFNLPKPSWNDAAFISSGTFDFSTAFVALAWLPLSDLLVFLPLSTVTNHFLFISLKKPFFFLF